MSGSAIDDCRQAAAEQERQWHDVGLVAANF
jgi:hypothetical protein